MSKFSEFTVPNIRADLANKTEDSIQKIRSTCLKIRGGSGRLFHESMLASFFGRIGLMPYMRYERSLAFGNDGFEYLLLATIFQLPGLCLLFRSPLRQACIHLGASDDK